jgi:rhodanese-related sulfurtransferase
MFPRLARQWLTGLPVEPVLKGILSMFYNIKISAVFLQLITEGVILLALFGYPRAAAEMATDAQKRQVIEKMVAEYRTKFPDVVEMDSRRVMELMKDQKVIFIDVRRPNEREVSMLPEAITHKTYLENPDQYSDYLKISYCTIGYRSARFAQIMHQNGTEIYNLHGGMLGWVHGGGKLYDKKGRSFRIHVYGRPWKLAPEGYEEVW